MKNKAPYFIGIDTETSNALIDEDGKLDLSQSLVYDVGWMILDKKCNEIKKRSYVVAEIFLDKQLMDTAYFKDKIPMYWEEIKQGKRTLAPFLKIRKQFLKDRKNYNVRIAFAHNAYFDYKSLNNTLRYLTGSKYRFFFPRSIKLWDTLKMSRDVFRNDEMYSNFCIENNFMTKHKTPRNQFTAEVIYRFLTGNINFEESHTGLEDVEIETKIFKHCLKSGRKMRRLLFS